MTTIALNSPNDEGAQRTGSLGKVCCYSYSYFTLLMLFLQIYYAYNNGHHYHHKIQWPPQWRGAPVAESAADGSQPKVFLFYFILIYCTYGFQK